MCVFVWPSVGPVFNPVDLGTASARNPCDMGFELFEQTGLHRRKADTLLTLVPHSCQFKTVFAGFGHSQVGSFRSFQSK